MDKNELRIKAGLKVTTGALCQRFSQQDQQKVQDDIAKFARANEKQLYKVLHTLSDVQLDLKTQIKSWVRLHPNDS